MNAYYTLLFNEITNAISVLNSLKERLIHSQQLAEELYISDEATSDEDNIS